MTTRIIFVLLLTTYACYAQNYDINSEQFSSDYLLLSAINGGHLGDYTIQPVPLRKLRFDIVHYADPSNRNFGIHYPQESPALRYEEFWKQIDNYYKPLMLQSIKNTFHDCYYTRDSVNSNHYVDNSRGSWFEPYVGLYHTFAYGDTNAAVIADVCGMARVGNVDNGTVSESFVLGRLSARAMGSLGEHLGFMLDLSNGLNAKGTPQIVALSDPTLGRTLKFSIDEKKFFDRYIGYVQYESEYFRARFGRENYAWGYSPIDNLVHSRYAPLMDGLLMDAQYKGVRFTSNHSAIEGLDVNGKAVINKFVSSHRIQLDPAPWLSMAVNDMIIYSGRGLDFAYLNPLGFYVSTGLGTVQKSDEDNSLIAADFAIRPIHGTLLYGSLLADDIGFSTLSATDSRGNNNKYAFQFGGSWSPVAMLLFSTEYARITPFTFSHRKVNNSWTHLGAPLGYNMQPNSDRIAVQAKYWLTARTFLQLDFDYTRWGENILDSKGNIATVVLDSGKTIIPVGNVGGNMLRGDGDFLPTPYNVRNEFLRGNVSHTRRLTAWFSTQVYSNIFADVRAQYTNRNSGNNPMQQLWFSFEVRVGY
ncbi:MAG: hypothetical protein U0Y96_04150 [Candidatus Kapaibacterium sp.]|nr:hypothetical protein [Bacteroidota bacterium]